MTSFLFVTVIAEGRMSGVVNLMIDKYFNKQKVSLRLWLTKQQAFAVM